MSDHSSVLVPIESWCYMSPKLRHNGQSVDLGLFAEALIYYDRILVNPPNAPAFTQFISWFVKQGKYGDLIALIKEGVINFYYYAFTTSAIENKGVYSVWNIQDERAVKSSMFDLQCLASTNLKEVLPHARQQGKLRRAIEGKVIEVKADNFGDAVGNAKSDYDDPDRCKLLLQALLDEVYPLLNLKRPPVIESQVVKGLGVGHIHYNINLDEISQGLGKNLNFHLGSPLTAAAVSNRLLWSTAELGCDLYLNSPMSTLVGDKLYESNTQLTHSHSIIEQLKTEVEFPDIRQLVNSGQIDLKTVLEFRQKGHRFRKWLQQESDRDRNALIAYHNEVAKEAGWIKGSRKALGLFGILSGAAIGAAVGTIVAGPPGQIAGAVAGSGVTYMIELASKLNEEWRPVVFGNWAQDRIQKEIRNKQDRG